MGLLLSFAHVRGENRYLLYRVVCEKEDDQSEVLTILWVLSNSSLLSFSLDIRGLASNSSYRRVTDYTEGTKRTFISLREWS